MGLYAAPPKEKTHGYLLSKEGSFTSVDVPGSILTTVWDVNPAGEIVGIYTDTSGKEHGFLLSHQR